jgi:hypothetical protein
MKRYYSQQTGCTYLPFVHGNQMPSDAVEISETLYVSVIGNPPFGKVRAHDEHGLPYLVDAPEPDPEVPERAWRDGELTGVLWLRDRHRDQLEISDSTTLETEQFSELLAYVQILRDWPQSPDFPDSQFRPTAPDWIAEQTQ